MNENIVGSYMVQTTDWSAHQLSNVINEVQEKYGEKLIVSGSDLEAFETEYQVFVFSKEMLTDSELDEYLEKIKKEMTEKDDIMVSGIKELEEKITPIIIANVLNKIKQPPSDQQIEAIFDEIVEMVDEEGYTMVFDGEEVILEFINEEIGNVVERVIVEN